MGKREIKALRGKNNGFCSGSNFGLQWCLTEGDFHPGGLFASVGHVGDMGFGISPNSPNSRDNNGGFNFKVPYTDFYVKYVVGFRIVGVSEGSEVEGLKKKRTELKKL